MNPWKTACLALAATVLAGSAWSAEDVGRITYISADREQLMLDNSRMYTLTSSAEAGTVAVGERVELKLGGADNKQVTKVNRLS